MLDKYKLQYKSLPLLVFNNLEKQNFKENIFQLRITNQHH